MEPWCKRCGDTGRRIMPDGEHSDYLDCTAFNCNAVTEQVDMERVVSEQLGYSLPLDTTIQRIVEVVRVRTRHLHERRRESNGDLVTAAHSVNNSADHGPANDLPGC